MRRGRRGRARVLRARAEASFPFLPRRRADRREHRRHRRPRDLEQAEVACTMQIATVVGTVVATQKHPASSMGRSCSWCSRRRPTARRAGRCCSPIDSVGAGIGERVLVVIEGKAAGDALGRRARRSTRRSSVSSMCVDDRRSPTWRRWRPHDRGRSARARPPGGFAPPHRAGRRRRRRGGPTPAPGVHPSFGRYLLPREPDDSGACLDRAHGASCNHCGFCQSHGF